MVGLEDLDAALSLYFSPKRRSTSKSPRSANSNNSSAFKSPMSAQSNSSISTSASKSPGKSQGHSPGQSPAKVAR